MFAQRQLTELAERKRLHVLEAGLHRTLVRAECMSMHERRRWLNEAGARNSHRAHRVALGGEVQGGLK